MKDYHINIFPSDEGRLWAAAPSPRERGDYRSYWISLIIVGGAICFLLFLYHQMDPILMGLWGARSGPYLDEYRTGERPDMETVVPLYFIMDVPVAANSVGIFYIPNSVWT